MPTDVKDTHYLNDLLKASWSELSFPGEHLQNIVGLYEKYRHDLVAVQEEQLTLFSTRKEAGLIPQLCDIEAEITYLRIRESKPAVVVEISPASGWSTSWILHALKDNGSGVLHSYDLVNDSIGIIPLQLAGNRWQFHQGDVTQLVNQLPPSVDYLFIDSDHSEEFAHWYIKKVFPMYATGTKVSVHDILKWAHEPGWGKESLVLCSWLTENNIKCMTASRALKDKGFLAISKIRSELHLKPDILNVNYNSMIFFEL
jgi:predicted O-methyltransferase YrrM